MPAIVDYDSFSQTYVVRCIEHGDPAGRTQWGEGRVTIFQGHGASSDARRYVREHNAIQHADEAQTAVQVPVADPLRADGHVRLCAGCNRSFYLDWVPEAPTLDTVPFRCAKCKTTP